MRDMPCLTCRQDGRLFSEQEMQINSEGEI